MIRGLGLLKLLLVLSLVQPCYAGFIITDYLEIPSGASDDVDTTGEIGVDTSDEQFLYNSDDSATPHVLQDVDYKCLYYPNLAADSDNQEMWMANDACEIVAIGVHCVGTCTTGADITLEDRAHNAMTHTTPTHSTGTNNTTFQSVTAANALVAGEGLLFDVDNAVSPETDDYLICFGIKYTRQ